MAAKDTFKQIRDLADAGLNAPEETGNLEVYKKEIVDLRGILRGVYEANTRLQNAYIGAGEDLLPKAEEEWKKINLGTTNYSAPTQVIIGENVNIPIPDIFE